MKSALQLFFVLPVPLALEASSELKPLFCSIDTQPPNRDSFHSETLSIPPT